ncbi:hypothetical protein [Mariniblastus fucicola]|nr:hypothetical protein [Mariniblastus fucicola]
MNQQSTDNKVVKRFGGRHLIFRTKVGKKSILPKPYALISSFSGPEWFFYGIGQVFLTHEKFGEFEHWGARLPRSSKARARLEKLIMGIEPELNCFIQHCNEHGIEGTIVVEENVIEFHWTFGHELEQEKLKDEHKSPLDRKFDDLVAAFVREKQIAFS